MYQLFSSSVRIWITVQLTLAVIAVLVLRAIKGEIIFEYGKLLSTAAGSIFLATITGLLGIVIGLIVWVLIRPKLDLANACGASSFACLLLTSTTVLFQA